jgi:hypothetical protein
MSHYARTTHTHDEAIVVFHIGMTFNKPWRVDQWGPVFAAMPRMIAELERNRAAAERGEEEWLGFMGARTTIGSRGPTVIQWWRSTEDLQAYASNQGLQHRPAWTAFNSRARRAGDAVGIWHETYAVPAGGIETIYGGLRRPLGLSAVSGEVPVARRGERAGERLGRRLDAS